MGMKGQFFTIDGVLALTIIVLSLITISRFYIHENPTNQLELYSEDMNNMLNVWNINDTNSTYINNLIQAGIIFDLDNSILETASIFWAKGDINTANKIIEETSKNIIPNQLSYGIFFDEESIYQSSNKNSKQLITSSKSITGIEKNKISKSYIVKASLSQLKDKTYYTRKFFGGYIGEGNLTFNINIPNEANSIKGANFEFDTDSDFSIYVNNHFISSYNKEDFYYNITNTNDFQIGDNKVEIIFINNGYIAGGYFSIEYIIEDIVYIPEEKTKILLTGINGFINYYSGISTRDIESMNINLHLDSEYNTQMLIGNVTVYEENPNGEKTITINDNTLKNILNYQELSNKTTPIRIKLNNISQPSSVDVVLITDLSGSMEFCSNENGDYATNMIWTNFNYPDKEGQSACGSKWIRTRNCRKNAKRRIDIAKEASLAFSNNLISRGNRLGLVEYSAEYTNSRYVQQPCKTNIIEFPDGIVGEIALTNDINVINNHINNMDSWYGTCICCGVERATQQLTSENNKAIVIMTDGEANVGCYSSNAKKDAITASLNACAKGIDVYTVGFGSSVEKTTLQKMACNNGQYFDASNADELSNIYTTIAENIITYNKQTASTNISHNTTKLFADSYIEIIQSKEEKNGILFNLEKQIDNNISYTTLDIPDKLKLNKMIITSYSKNYWTNNITINNEQIFNLDSFNLPYTDLGDIYSYEIHPKNLLNKNSIYIRTGLENKKKGGSDKNKIFYEVLYTPVVKYTNALPKSQGCIWQLEFEDDTSANIRVPNDYLGTEICNFRNDIYDSNDAMQVAAYLLFGNIDFDNDKKIFFNIKELSMNIGINEIGGVPKLIGPTKAEVRVWR